jgi:alpha-tubulin suppressor-like RCC1 family protein
LCLWACDSTVADVAPTAALSLHVLAADGFSSTPDQGRIYVEGPTPRTVLIEPGTTETISGLVPGTYTVAVEGLIAGEVESYGERGGIVVTAGANTPVTVVRTDFVPVLGALDGELQPGQTMDVAWNPVPGADEYRLEWDDDGSFPSPTVVELDVTSTVITLEAPGTYYVRVRAMTRFGNAGQPSSTGSTQVSNPGPVIASVDPSVVTAGGDGFELTVHGSGFVPGSEVRWNGDGRPTTYLDEQRLQASILASDIADAGTAQVAVHNPQPGGGVSGVVTVTIQSAAVVWAQVVSGESHTCGMTTAGTAYCWGAGDRGQLGNGSAETKLTPVPVSGGLVFDMLSAGSEYTCGVTTSGSAYCWGKGDQGQLGDGSTADRLSPVRVIGAPAFASIATGRTHTCAATAAGDAYCWGSGAQGRLGNGSTTDHPTPVLVSGGHQFDAIGTGYWHSCGLTAQRQGYCWGGGGSGQLGTGSGANRLTPTPVSGGLSWAEISAGIAHTCGLTVAGAGYCWGFGSDGRLGNTGAVSDVVPAPVPVSGGLTFSTISAGVQHSCGLTTGGDAYCWGDGTRGQLGEGATVHRFSPVPVSGGLTFDAISASWHSCAVTSAGEAYCWGGGSVGQLGNGSTEDRLTPMRVSEP